MTIQSLDNCGFIRKNYQNVKTGAPSTIQITRINKWIPDRSFEKDSLGILTKTKSDTEVNDFDTRIVPTHDKQFTAHFKDRKEW